MYNVVCVVPNIPHTRPIWLRKRSLITFTFFFCSLVDYSLLMIVVSPRILSRKIQSWLTLLHWLHYGFHYEIGVPTFFAVGCSRVILQLEGLILTYPFGHELCKEEHRNDSSPLSSSWFSISNWANTWERTFHAIRTFWRSLHVSNSQNSFLFLVYLLISFLAGKFNFNFEFAIFWVEKLWNQIKSNLKTL